MEGEYLSLDTAKRLHKEKENKIDKKILEANIKLVDENKQLQQENKQLQQQCKKQQEVIDKLEKYIEKETRIYGLSMSIELGTHFDNILGILKEVSY